MAHAAVPTQAVPTHAVQSPQSGPRCHFINEVDSCFCQDLQLLGASRVVTDLAAGWAEAGTRKLPGGAEEQGVSSMRASLPQPARTMFFAT